MTMILVPREDWTNLLDAVDRSDEPLAAYEPWPATHTFTPYLLYEGEKSICGHNGCGGSLLSPVHYV